MFRYYDKLPWDIASAREPHRMPFQQVPNMLLLLLMAKQVSLHHKHNNNRNFHFRQKPKVTIQDQSNNNNNIYIYISVRNKSLIYKINKVSIIGQRNYSKILNNVLGITAAQLAKHCLRQKGKKLKTISCNLIFNFTHSKQIVHILATIVLYTSQRTNYTSQTHITNYYKLQAPSR